MKKLTVSSPTISPTSLSKTQLDNRKELKLSVLDLSPININNTIRSPMTSPLSTSSKNYDYSDTTFLKHKKIDEETSTSNSNRNSFDSKLKIMQEYIDFLKSKLYAQALGNAEMPDKNILQDENDYLHKIIDQKNKEIDNLRERLCDKQQIIAKLNDKLFKNQRLKDGSEIRHFSLNDKALSIEKE